MATKGELKINAIIMPDHSLKYAPGFISFEVMQRTIDNTLVSDLKDDKRKFSLSWDNALDGAFVESIIALYVAGADVTFTVTDEALVDTVYDCHISISLEILRKFSRKRETGNYAYSGFAIELEEI